jgi:hypothetical protein
LLFKPFRLGRSWKLAAVSYLAWGSSFFFPWPLLLLLIPRFVKGPLGMPLWLLATFAVAPTLVMAVIHYCCVRLNLVDFEMVVTGAKMIGPMWRKYSAKVWPWLAVKTTVSVAAVGMMAPLIVVQVREFIRVADAMPAQGDQADPRLVMRMFGSFFALYATMLLLFLVPKFFGTLLDDFVLPFFVLEDGSVWGAIRRGACVFRNDPWNCLGYLAMKMILGAAGYVMQSIALQVCMIPVFIIGVVMVVVGHALFAHAGLVGHVFLIAAGVVLGVAFYAAILYAMMLSLGYLLLLLDSYAVYFLGGRYSMLGNLLEAGPGGPFAPPPVFPSEEEQKDDDGGPPMPMNPAVA